MKEIVNLVTKFCSNLYKEPETIEQQPISTPQSHDIPELLVEELERVGTQEWQSSRNP